MKRRLRLLGRDERGVVGVLVGLLIGTVLLGLGAVFASPPPAVPPASYDRVLKVHGWLEPSNQCSGSNKCINGYFTQEIIPYTGSMSSTYLGAAVIRITG